MAELHCGCLSHAKRDCCSILKQKLHFSTLFCGIYLRFCTTLQSGIKSANQAYGESIMGKKVLVAVNPESVAYHSIFYGIQLAARINSSLSLIVVSSSKGPGD